MKRANVLWTVVGLLAMLSASVTVTHAFRWALPWLPIATTVLLAVLALPNKVVVDRLARRHTRADERGAQLESRSIGAGRKTIRQISDATALGVHRAVLPAGWTPDPNLESPPALPAYVPRDQHEAMVSMMRPGQFVLIVGDSGAGKTRLAYEVVSEVLGDHRLFAPEPAALDATLEEMAATRAAVLWLDDLERFLGTDTLSSATIDRLLGGAEHHRVVVATLRLQELDTLTVATDADRCLTESRRRVLAMAERVRIEKMFTPAEVTRARRRSHDPRLADALEHADQYGIAEYLAAGPQLLQRWQDGTACATHPRGAALVTAAVDCRRAGYLGPLPTALLDEIHEHYLATGCPRSRPEPLDAAWRWALEPWRHTTALLEPAHEGTVTVFDYVVDHVQRTRPFDPPPDDVLRAALRHAAHHDAQSMAYLAAQSGRYRMAFELHAHALATITRSGREHEILSVRNNLANALSDLGHHDEAVPMYREVLAARIQTRGADHLDTLTVRGNLATALVGIGHHEEAATEFRVVVAAMTGRSGADHPNTLRSRNNLANALVRLGHDTQALDEFRSLAEAATRVLGADHPDMLSARNNYAIALCEVGAHREAVEEHRAVLAARRAILGPDHPDTLGSRNNLGNALGDVGLHTEAFAVLTSAVDAAVRVLGEEHPDTLSIRDNLASVLHDLGRHDDAVAGHHTVLEARTRILGRDHPDTLGTHNNYANALGTVGRYKDAVAEHRWVLTARTRVLGADHPDTHKSRDNLAAARARRTPALSDTKTPALSYYTAQESLSPRHPTT